MDDHVELYRDGKKWRYRRLNRNGQVGGASSSSRRKWVAKLRARRAYPGVPVRVTDPNERN